MKKIIPVLALLILYVVWPAHGQIYYQKQTGAMSIPAISTIPATTTIRVDTILTTQALPIRKAPGSETCGTEPVDSLAAISQPYYGNNQFLINLADSVEAGSCSTCRVTGGLAPEVFRIPVKVWMYRTNEGLGGLANDRVERLIN